MRVKGKDIAIYREVGGTFRLIALSLSCDVLVSCDMKEFSSFLSGRAKRVRAGRYGWQMNCEAIVAVGVGDGEDLLAALKSGERLRISMSLHAPEASMHAVRGWALVASWSESAPLAGMATYKVNFQGDGELE